MEKLFRPDAYYPSVLEIDLELLKEKGIKGVLLDLDNTLLEGGHFHIEPEIVSWVEKVKAEFEVCLLSNNFFDSRYFAKVLGIMGASNFVGKPFKRPFRIAQKKIGLPKKEIAMVGDQIFTDIFGGNRFGIYTILVSPRGSLDPWHTKFLRKAERRITRKFRQGWE